MRSCDPLLQAVAQGDERCPEGRDLVALGRLCRAAGRLPQRPDLVEGVLAAIDPAAAQQAADIDAVFQAEADDAPVVLRRLRRLTRQAATPPATVDLLPRLEARLRSDVSSRRLALVPDQQTRWRVYVAVAIGHVAAIVALAIFASQVPLRSPNEGESLVGASDGLYLVPLPEHRWQTLPAPTMANAFRRPAELVALREAGEARQRLLSIDGLQDAQGIIQAGSAWLVQQLPALQAALSESPDDRRLQQVRALMLLALLGEGQTHRGQWQPLLATLQTAGPSLSEGVDETAFLQLWALIDGSLLTGEADGRQAAETAWQAVAALPAAQQVAADPGRLCFLLALSQAAGVQVPALLQADLEARLRRPEADGAWTACARLFLHGELPPADAPDSATQPADLLAGLPHNMLWREMSGSAWARSAEHLQATLVPRFQFEGSGLASVNVDSEPGDPAMASLAATASAIIQLQVGHRYAPLRRRL